MQINELTVFNNYYDAFLIHINIKKSTVMGQTCCGAEKVDENEVQSLPVNKRSDTVATETTSREQESVELNKSLLKAQR